MNVILFFILLMCNEYYDISQFIKTLNMFFHAMCGIVVCWW
jgi:hypothetical protein